MKLSKIFKIGFGVFLIFLGSPSINQISAQDLEEISSARSKILDVPYKAQPDKNSCQSTCLRMYEMYLTNKSNEILDIYKTINKGSQRPVKVKNSWKNFLWWLEENISDHDFELTITDDEIKATEFMIESIDNGFPIILSTNHTRTKGHIIMVVGYINYVPNQSNAEFKFICHDPFGAFHPELHSQLYGEKRYENGKSNSDGGEEAIGKNVLLSLNALKRIRIDKHNSNKFVMINAN